MNFLSKKILQVLLWKESVRKEIFQYLLMQIKRDKSASVKVIGSLRPLIIQEVFQYPSIINNGYLHIERAIEIIKSKGINRKIIIDVGAAAGETCILFSKAFPSFQVLGFEPISDSFKKLEDNTKGFKNIKVFNTALGNNNGDLEMNITNRVTASSLLSTNESQRFNDEDYFKIIRKEKIRVKTLDSIISNDESVALIKLDVQGFELEVLKGAIHTLKRTSFILLEMQNHSVYNGAPLYYQLDEFLRTNSFELFDLIPSIRVDLQVKEYDALYVNKEQ